MTPRTARVEIASFYILKPFWRKLRHSPIKGSKCKMVMWLRVHLCWLKFYFLCPTARHIDLSKRFASIYSMALLSNSWLPLMLKLWLWIMLWRRISFSCRERTRSLEALWWRLILLVPSSGCFSECLKKLQAKRHFHKAIIPLWQVSHWHNSWWEFLLLVYRFQIPLITIVWSP